MNSYDPYAVPYTLALVLLVALVEFIALAIYIHSLPGQPHGQ